MEKYINGCSLYTFSIYNDKNKKCLKLHEHGITQITYNENSETYICIPYKDLKFNTKDEQIIKNILNDIENNIKYYVKQCLTYKRLRTDIYINSL